MVVDVFGLLKKNSQELSIGTTNLSNREKWLKKELLKIPKGKKILDAGAGELQYKKFCRNLKYVSQDFAQYDGAGDNIGLQTGEWDNSRIDIVSDIIAIPVKNSSFDAIMCIEVFEHIPEPALAVKEFSRIIKRGGKLIISSPFASLTHFAPHYYSSGYSEYWYNKILADNGFRVDKIVKNGNYYEYMAQENRRILHMSKHFSGLDLSKDRRSIKTVKSVLELLDKVNKYNRNSEDMLCFGLQVSATKI